jgi:hypothetical protein
MAAIEEQIDTASPVAGYVELYDISRANPKTPAGYRLADYDAIRGAKYQIGPREQPRTSGG